MAVHSALPIHPAQVFVEASWHVPKNFPRVQLDPAEVLVRAQPPPVDLSAVQLNVTDAIINTRVASVHLAIFFHPSE